MINNKNKKEMDELYKNTTEWNDNLKNLGYNLVPIWECEFNKFKKDKMFKEFIKSWNRNVITPLDSHDAFFGGRTNATKLYYKCKPGEEH